MRQYLISCVLAVATSVLLVAASSAQAAAPAPGSASQPMPAVLDVPTGRLRLATEVWQRDAGFAVVDVGLYAAAPVASRAEYASSTGTRCLRLVLQREMSSDLIGRLLMRDLEQASDRIEVSRHVSSLLKIGDAFAARKRLAAGESISFEFVPAQGTRLLIDGKPASDFIGDASLFAVLMRPWLRSAVEQQPMPARGTTVALR